MMKAKERQAIFEAAFETEVEQYKQSGVIPSKICLLPKLQLCIRNCTDFSAFGSRTEPPELHC